MKDAANIELTTFRKVGFIKGHTTGGYPAKTIVHLGIQNLENEVHSVRKEVSDLKETVARKQNQIENLNDVVRKLLDALIEQGVCEEGSLEHLTLY